jgi:hypothetical protein
MQITANVPVAGNPTMMITNLSDAVVPITSSGAALSPSGNRWGIGLSIVVASRRGVPILSFLVNVGTAFNSGAVIMESNIMVKVLILTKKILDSYYE